MKETRKILSDYPAWRDIYLKGSISVKLPQRFCGTQCVENEDTAEKAILVLPDIVALIKHFLALCPSKSPKNNKSLDKLAQSVSDKQMITKLTFLKEVLHILNEFLRPFLADNPMVPFFMWRIWWSFEATYESVYPQVNSRQSWNTIFTSDVLRYQ